MKKNFTNFLIVLILTAVLGASLIELCFWIFGPVAVFMTAVVVVAVAGIAVTFSKGAN